MPQEFTQSRSQPRSLDDLQPGESVRHPCGNVYACPVTDDDWDTGEFWDGAENLCCPVCLEDHGEATAYGGWYRLTKPRRLQPKEERVEALTPKLFGKGRPFAKLPPEFWEGCRLLEVKPLARLVIFALWQREACGGRCRISTPALAEELGVADSTVRKLLKELEERKLLAVEHGRRIGRRQATNEYDLLPFWTQVAKVTATAPAEPEPADAPESEPAEAPEAEGVPPSESGIRTALFAPLPIISRRETAGYGPSI
jgi:hypothetical protein